MTIAVPASGVADILSLRSGIGVDAAPESDDTATAAAAAIVLGDDRLLGGSGDAAATHATSKVIVPPRPGNTVALSGDTCAGGSFSAVIARDAAPIIGFGEIFAIGTATDPGNVPPVAAPADPVTSSIAAAKYALHAAPSGASSAAASSGVGPSAPVSYSFSPETITYPGSGIVFVNSYGSGVTAAYHTCILTAENFFQSQYTNAVTVYMNFDLQSLANIYSAQNNYNSVNVSFAALEGALEAHEATAADAAAVASLIIPDPSGGQGFALSPGIARVLGFLGPNILGTTDDSVVLNSNLTWAYNQDAIGTIEHEMSEGVFGRVGGLGLQGNSWGPMDLYRYSAVGQRDYTGGLDGSATYFAVDGTFLLTQFHNSLNTSGVYDQQDFADWNTGGGDAFGGGGPGNPGVVNSVDQMVLDVLGWDRTSAIAYTVAAGQTSNNIVVYSGDKITVQSGGSATATYALSGGLEVISAGGSESGARISSGAEQDVFGSASAAVFAGGVQIVESGGTASGTTLSAGASETVQSGATASATTIDSAAIEIASGGATAAGVTLLAGGTLEVFGGVSLFGFTWSAGTFALGSGYQVFGEQVGGGETLELLSSGSATDSLVSGGGLVAVASGGVASGTTLAAGGSETVIAGGLETGGTVSGGATLTVYQSGEAASITVEGGTESVLGGSGLSTTIDSGGVLSMFGGATTSTTINNGGNEFVSSGGVATSTTINAGGSLTVFLGGDARFDAVNSGGVLVVSSGGHADDATNTINNGGLFFVLSGGHEQAAFINSGGILVESSGGSAGFNILSGGGSETLLPGSFPHNDELVSGGSVAVSSGVRVVNDTTGSGGGTVTVLSGGSALLASVFSGGSQVVSAGGSASFDLIRGGSETADGGGVLDETVFAPFPTGGALYNGGSLVVLAGGSATSTTVYAGVFGGVGSVTVSAGGNTFADSLSGGYETVSAGGIATSTSIGTLSGLGGILTVSSGGLSSAAVILSGGTLIIEPGGTADPPTISSGGLEIVSSGGTTDGVTIGGTGATLDLLSGAVVEGSIAFSDSGGQLQIGGANAADMPSNTILGFVSGDTVDLTNIPFDSGGSAVLAGSSGNQNQLQITENGVTYVMNLDPGQNFTGDFFHLADDLAGGTLVSEDQTACYCRGTLILSDRGERPVEELAIGDRVVTLSGALRPIKWIGHRAFDPRLVAGNEAILPVRIAASALGEGLPRRDLWVSPEHALYLDGVLVAARLLVNGWQIVQVEQVDRLEYFHVELEGHDVILAEGAAVETYVECDNRGMFHNAAEFAALFPYDAGPSGQFCAPRMDMGSPELTGVRAMIAARLEAQAA